MGAQMIKEPVNGMRSANAAPGYSTVCENCGRVFQIGAEVTSRSFGDLKMHCER